MSKYGYLVGVLVGPFDFEITIVDCALTQNYERGLLKMIDIDKFIWSLKISWIKRLVGN